MGHVRGHAGAYLLCAAVTGGATLTQAFDR